MLTETTLNMLIILNSCCLLSQASWKTFYLYFQPVNLTNAWIKLQIAIFQNKLQLIQYHIPKLINIQKLSNRFEFTDMKIRDSDLDLDLLQQNFILILNSLRFSLCNKFHNSL